FLIGEDREHALVLGRPAGRVRPPDYDKGLPVVGGNQQLVGVAVPFQEALQLVGILRPALEFTVGVRVGHRDLFQGLLGLRQRHNVYGGATAGEAGRQEDESEDGTKHAVATAALDLHAAPPFRGGRPPPRTTGGRSRCPEKKRFCADPTTSPGGRLSAGGLNG